MTQPPVHEQFCGACRYWRDGECRRHAPTPDADWAEAVWPIVEATDWCGEWVARDERGMAELSPDAKKEAAKLAAEIRHFLHGYRQMRGLDPEHIYSIHLGDDMEAHLRVSRLARIADLLESVQ